jgi:hypothetical protein
MLLRRRQICQEIGMPGYGAFDADGANLNLVIGSDACFVSVFFIHASRYEIPPVAQAAPPSGLCPHRCNEMVLCTSNPMYRFPESFIGVYSCLTWRTSPEKAGHVPFSGLLSYLRMRAVTLLHHSQFSKCERGNQTLDLVGSGSIPDRLKR